MTRFHRVATLYSNLITKLEIELYSSLLFFNKTKEDKIINIDLKKIEDSKDTTTNLLDLSNTTYLSNFRESYIKRFYNTNSYLYKYFNKNNKLEANIRLYLK